MINLFKIFLSLLLPKLLRIIDLKLFCCRVVLIVCLEIVWDALTCRLRDMGLLLNLLRLLTFLLCSLVEEDIRSEMFPDAGPTKLP